MPQVENSRTLILIKPDAIQRGLSGEIIKRFERKGFRIVKAEMRFVDEELAKKHYDEHKNNGNYFAKMIEAITHGPVIAMILEGPNAPENSRQLIGSASPHSSPVGTIRGDLAYEEAFNLVHGSDCAPAAYREIALWFSEDDYWPEGVDSKKKKKMGQKFDPTQYVLSQNEQNDIVPGLSFVPDPDPHQQYEPFYEDTYEKDEVF